jgi:hypothetical protein
MRCMPGCTGRNYESGTMPRNESEWPERTPPIIHEIWYLMQQMEPIVALAYCRSMQKKLEMKLPFFGRRYHDDRPAL